MKHRSEIYSLAAALAGATSAIAVPTVYSGGDAGAFAADPRPLSNAAAAIFDAAAGTLGAIQVVDFEASPLGPYTTLPVGGGASISGLDDTSNLQEIRDDPLGSPAFEYLFGYNTTLGGAKFASIYGGFLTISFATPVQAFGGYFSGVQSADETLTFNDGSPESVHLLNQNGVQFIGFVSAGGSISSITINAGAAGDIIGLDDFRFVTSESSIPESGNALVMVGLGAAAAVALRRRPRARVSARTESQE